MQYRECIHGYLVMLQPPSGVAGPRPQTVNGSSLVAEFVDLEPGTYTVVVTPRVVSGFDELIEGMPESIRLDVGTGRRRMSPDVRRPK